jgi:hypothetical protein
VAGAASVKNAVEHVSKGAANGPELGKLASLDTASTAFQPLGMLALELSSDFARALIASARTLFGNYKTGREVSFNL